MIDSWLGIEPAPTIILGQTAADERHKGKAVSAGSLDDNSELDGRKKRSSNTKIKIVDALLDLVNEGDYRPTARQIAVRAGVSERSVFQHFTDLNELHSAVGQRQFDRLVKFRAPISNKLDFQQRLRIYVNQRAKILEAVTPIRRALVVIEPTSTSLLKLRQTFHQMNISHIEEAFKPEFELEITDPSLVVDAVEAATSWHCWESIRFQGYSVSRAKKILTLTVGSILRR